MSLFSLLEKSAIRNPAAGAVYSGERLIATYGDLRRHSLGIATALRRSECSPGDRVVIASENRPEYIELMFAIWAAGLIAVPVNAKLHPQELAAICEDCGASLLFASPKVAESSATFAVRSIEIGSSAYESMRQDDAATPIQPDLQDPAWIFFTSGTTGRAKGAILSHRSLIAMTIAHLADFEALSEEDAIIHAAPLSHGSGLYMLPYVASGARQVIPASGGFDPIEFLDLADIHAGSGAFLAPTMVQRLRIAAETNGRSPSSIRSIIYGGGPMYLDEIKRSLSFFGPIFRQLYGQGEAPMTITGLKRKDFLGADDDQLASVGWARSGVEVAIIDPQGRSVPMGEVGEIVCRGDVVMDGYWDNPTATAATLRNGWLHTGDLGSFDATGRLTLRDRSKDVIISGGTNIYPREVEEALLLHPAVQQACVVGEHDSEWGESVVAAIVLNSEGVGPAELDHHCLQHIARFKRPKRYIFVDSLPKNENGKVLKTELRSMLAASNRASVD